jgi:hypothetical protein
MLEEGPLVDASSHPCEHARVLADPSQAASKPPAARTHLIIAVIALLVFGTGLGFMIHNEAKAEHLREHGVQVDAEIVGTERIRDRDPHGDSDKYRYYLTLVFEHPAEGRVELRHPTSQNGYATRRRASRSSPMPITIVVDRADSSYWMEARHVFREGENYAIPVFGTLMGISGTYALLAGLLLARRRRTSRAPRTT